MAVIIVMAAAFAFGAATTIGQPADPIDLTADVEASNCVPCHVRIAEARKPGLIFQHGHHLMVSCEACHYRAAHEDGKTYSPPMESCFNCHGIQHGPQGELASSKCEDCHTKSFKLRPSTHVKNWEKTPHAERAKTGVNSCMMCHDAPKDCDKCHKDEGVDVGPMPKGYETLMLSKPKRTTVKVFPDGPTSMGQCIHCHPDIDDFVPGKVIFEHAEHLRRNYQCTVCHPKFGHDQVNGVRRPDMQSCYRCHGLTHAASGLVATEECGACHPKEFELKPSDHTAKFELKTHGKRAATDGAYCAMCHQSAFCVECHMGRKTRGDGTRGKVVPDDHKKAEWMGKHGGLFLAQEGSCGSCHDSKSCKPCHQTPMPHPADWVKGHAEDKEDQADDCNVCHTDRDKCQSCHHESVKRAELTAKNCTPCHEEMKQKPATAIKNKGFAEHAVHFDIAEKDRNNGKPYKCYECHVGFGNGSSGTAHESSLKEAAHDLRLCYECHGALDPMSRLIAPWKGAELCRRCHADLNI